MLFLETINYIEHDGLMRRRNQAGTSDRITPQHHTERVAEAAIESINPFVTLVNEAVLRVGADVARAEFIAAQPPVLLKRPTADASDFAPPRMGFVTEYLDMNAPSPAGLGPLANKWLVVQLKKRPGSPFGDRISVGRATNCDAVVRFAFVSKLHAHVLADDGGSYRYVVHGAANVTCINGRSMEPAKPLPLEDGDRLTIGPLALEFLLPASFFNVLRARSP